VGLWGCSWFVDTIHKLCAVCPKTYGSDLEVQNVDGSGWLSVQHATTTEAARVLRSVVESGL